MTSLFTVSDAVAVLETLDCGLSERQIRYLGLPSRRPIHGMLTGRLYATEDLVVLALFAQLLERCREWQLPTWAARAAIRYREAEIRRAIVRRTPRYVVIDPIRGTATLAESADKGQRAIDVRELTQRVDTAARAFRATYPEVWTGTAYIDAQELVTA